MYPINDTEFEDKIIKDVQVFEDSIQFTCTDDIGFSFSKKDLPEGLEVKEGGAVRFYGRGVCFTVRGLFIEGQKIYYRTPEEDDLYQAEQRLEATEKQLREYEEKKGDYATRLAKLPEPFRARIERFHRANLNFGADFEGYELFCCEQAVLIATEITSGSLKDPEKKANEILKEFYNMSYEEQGKKVPKLSLGEHSGNTFGKSCELAQVYIEAPARLPHAHGALCPLVGCDQYGCFAMEISSDE